MTAPAKLAAFAAALAVIGGGAAIAGGAVNPDRGGGGSGGGGDGAEHAGHAEEQSTPAAEAGPAEDVTGLAVAENGLRLVVDEPELTAGRRSPLSFRIVAEDGRAVTDYDVKHEKRMHLIVVRRDLTGFQHLHPELGEDGTWSTDITLPDPGSYRLFADFSRGGESQTLASDLRVDGDADLEPLPAASDTARTGSGYEVRRHGLEFEVTKDGKAVDPDPYLGAKGHLVALREGDLAYLHVHPEENALAFQADFPTTGRYRLFLQFKHLGAVHTAAFTEEQR